MEDTLKIQKVESLNEKDLNVVKKKSKKKQIFLYDTRRRYDDFIKKIKFRNNGKYEDVPHFIITKTGEIYQLFSTKHSSKSFDDPKIDKKQIKIALENLGWLNKNSISGILHNWINDPYRSTPYVKKWRGYFFWDKYTDEQLLSLRELCKVLCSEHEIPYVSVPSQTTYDDIIKFNGIVCKSNFIDIYKDINPSFDFKIFKEYE
jgi:N-acetyl-anhydromuramyl-L-alanine amidase AmpD